MDFRLCTFGFHRFGFPGCHEQCARHYCVVLWGGNLRIPMSLS